MLLCCWWTALLPMAVLGQTYYINFVFNNYRTATDNSSEENVIRLMNLPNSTQSASNPYIPDQSDSHETESGSDSSEEKLHHATDKIPTTDETIGSGTTDTGHNETGNNGTNTGGTGNGTSIGGPGNGTSIGGPGNGTSIGGLGNGTSIGGPGNGTSIGGPGNGTSIGGPGNGTDNGGASTASTNSVPTTTAIGGLGNGTSIGGPGNGTSIGGPGNGTGIGGPGNGTSIGGLGNGTDNGGASTASTNTVPETTIGGLGNGTSIGGPGNGTSIGGPGNGTDNGGASTASTNSVPTTTAIGGLGNGTSIGGPGNGTSIGGPGNGTSIGGPGNGTSIGGPGNGTSIGGLGNGTDNGGASTASTNSVPTTTAIGGLGNGTSIGGPGNGTSIGGPGNGTSIGGPGNGTSIGGPGNGTSIGGPGNGTSIGGPGNGTSIGGPGNGTSIGGPGNGTDNGGTSTVSTKTVPTTTTIDWLSATPHLPNFFKYPEAECNEDMRLHEVFGITLGRDHGLPAKVLCQFNNSWGGPWLLMYRLELPVRVHFRHWIFGYLTDDYKDLNINYLSLAHIMNKMRLAMLIIGQNNNKQLVYNLYDDVVISSFNDLFTLRKAHLVESNTTDLLYLSVGEVIQLDAGRNRSCPFRVVGAWWGNKVEKDVEAYCVFPVERDVKKPGYVAFFIKPNPFKVNNTAFYQTEITTRRPWAATIDLELMQQANNQSDVYDELLTDQFWQNKVKVRKEVKRRARIKEQFEEERRKEDQAGTMTKT
ncbi:uncharacterized protein Dmoj_GI16002, isoform C [Drosophila mojavensis]|uniref:Uncharacterized protein, isoform C n=1 Tax=Drosophila mojavensis TaxID=7230 RepID=A0A0Q9X3A4_DROMO|nr:uncharacterized protein Dmoj_GI16002, isoform C [Drosophila mojavensis]